MLKKMNAFVKKQGLNVTGFAVALLLSNVVMSTQCLALLWGTPKVPKHLIPRD